MKSGLWSLILPFLFPVTAAAAQPEIFEPERFEKLTLSTDMKDPMELGVAPDGRVFFAERGGNVKVYLPATKTTVVTGTIKVFAGIEDGLLGLALDPAFARNGWIYLIYSPVGDKAQQYVSRFHMSGNVLDLGSEVVILTIATQRKECCHSGGSLAFGPGGNLFISTGDNTNPFQSDGFAPTDERPERAAFDAQRTAGNPFDLRGKILRIHPAPDGHYTIPKGNLFAKDGHKGRPEIYVMGCRNPFRISVDSRTGNLFWGEVGPDSRRESPRGPIGYDEINRAPKPGNFGWPYFIADNKPYAHYDFAAKQVGAVASPLRPINTSPHAGLSGPTGLPPPQKAWIFYPYTTSTLFPTLGDGGRSAMAGPVFHASTRATEAERFPATFEGSFFIFDWMRNWIKRVQMDSNGQIKSIEPFMEKTTFIKPMDMQFGSDGTLYVLEFGSKWADNTDSSLVRIIYRRGNRPPMAKATANVTAGKAPLTVSFSSGDSRDPDAGDTLSQKWSFEKADRIDSHEAAPTFVFRTQGTYKARLTVQDRSGLTSQNDVEIVVGNTPPKVAFTSPEPGTFFTFGKDLPYQVAVTDAEDGSVADGRIIPQRVLVNALYRATAKGESASPEEQGLALMKRSTCFACHTLNDKSQGPPYTEVAKRYAADPKAPEALAAKIISGGTGIWGEAQMMPNPQHDLAQTRLMVAWVLSLAKDRSKALVPGSSGAFKTIGAPRSGKDSGVYILSATYNDNPPPAETEETVVRSLSADATLQVRAPKVEAEHFEGQDGVQIVEVEDEGGGQMVTAIDDGDSLTLRQVNLKGISAISVRGALPEGEISIEVRTGAKDGSLLATLPFASTGGAQHWVTRTMDVRNPGGLHDLTFVFKRRGPGTPQLGLGINWVRFDKKP